MAESRPDCATSAQRGKEPRFVPDLVRHSSWAISIYDANIWMLTLAGTVPPRRPSRPCRPIVLSSFCPFALSSFRPYPLVAFTDNTRKLVLVL